MLGKAGVNPTGSPELAENFFRHEYGRLVAVLTRQFGRRQLEAIEDAAQSALMRAIESWSRESVPDSPAAWLTRVARRELLGELRRDLLHSDAMATQWSERSADAGDTDAAEATERENMKDDLLHMLFVCCDDALPLESQVVLALKTLCGFDIREIAQRLLTSEANVYKRHARALERLRLQPAEARSTAFDLADAKLGTRLSSVQLVLYLILTEGYLSAQPDSAIRAELCNEAIRLATILAEHPVGETPETFALLALMHLQTARLPGRVDGGGSLLLLAEQDRSLWNRAQILVGLEWLDRSATGTMFSRYHAEAGIAAEHCMASSFRATRWDRIVDCYQILTSQAPSPVHTLNHAVALAELQGPEAGLALLEDATGSERVSSSYLHAAVLADLHHRAGHRKRALAHRATAIERASSSSLRALIRRRLDWLESQ